MLNDAPSVPQRLSFDEEDKRAREIVRDLNFPRPAIYWIDLLAACGIGWAAFVLAVRFPFGSLEMIVAVGVASFALYRALCFLHEISHIPESRLPGFERVWNLLVGYPLLMPSFVYLGVHQDHHALSTYGTERDPEYMPFSSSSFMSVAFAVQSFLIPLALLVRFLVLGPIGLVSKSLSRWLIVHASSLTMNLQYRRTWTPELAGRVQLHTFSLLLLWGVFIALAVAGILPWRLFAVWFGVSSFASFVNTLRTLGAHAYESSGAAMNRAGQLADSINTPGAPWTELWAPVGLRYHALHHYFPGLPYHNLGQAHVRLAKALPTDALYHRANSPSLPSSLRTLFLRGMQR